MPNETILVVEDEPLVALAIREELERHGYHVPEIVSSGEDVMAAVARHSPQLVVMDIRLEGSVDGIEAAFQVKAEFDVPVLYLTASSDSKTLKRVAETAPDAFLLKPFDERELSANIEMTLAKARLGTSTRRDLLRAAPLIDALEGPAMITDADDVIVYANAEAAVLLKIHDAKRLRGADLSRFVLDPTGREGTPIQAADGSFPETVVRLEPLNRSDGVVLGNLVTFDRMSRKERLLLESSVDEINSTLSRLLPGPEAAGPTFEVGGFLAPCPSGSGDLYDAFRLGPGTGAFYALDVMGHGSLTSLIAYSLHDLVRNIAHEGQDGTAAGDLPSPRDLVQRLNERYAGSEEGKPFFTIVYGCLDGKTGAYRLVRAGHPPVIVLPVSGEARRLYSGGTAIGVVEDIEAVEASGVLGPGDRLVVASDGLLEAVGGLDEGAGGNSLLAFVLKKRVLPLAEFVSSIHDLVRELRPSLRDDASLLVIERRRPD